MSSEPALSAYLSSLHDELGSEAAAPALLDGTLEEVPVLYQPTGGPVGERLILGELRHGNGARAKGRRPNRPRLAARNAAARHVAAATQAHGAVRQALPIYIALRQFVEHAQDDAALIEASLGARFAALHEVAASMLTEGPCVVGIDGTHEPLDSLRLGLFLLHLSAFSKAHPNARVVASYRPEASARAPVQILQGCPAHDFPCWVPPAAWTPAERNLALTRFGSGVDEHRSLIRFAYGILRDAVTSEEVVTTVVSTQWEDQFRTYNPAKYLGTKCPFRNWIYRCVQYAAYRAAAPAPVPDANPVLPEPDPMEVLRLLLSRLEEAFAAEQFVDTTQRLGEVCLALRRSGVSLDEPELLPVIDYAAQVLGAKLDDDSAAHRKAAGVALGKMGLATSIWYPHLRELDRETLALCLYHRPPLSPVEAADQSRRPCKPLAMRQRLFQALERFARLLSQGRSPK